MVQNDKKFCLLHAISQEPNMIWSSFCNMQMWNDNISRMFFHFFSKFWFFRLLGREKGKNSPKRQKTQLCLISQESYVIWLSFMLHMCKMIISPSVFSFFQIFNFLVISGVKGQKMAKWQKILSLTLYLRNRTWYNCGFWYTCVKWWYLQHFVSFFQNLDFSGF